MLKKVVRNRHIAYNFSRAFKENYSQEKNTGIIKY